MSNHKYNNQHLLIGAAVAAGILGTLTGLLGTSKPKGFAGHARNLANQVLDSSDMVNKNMVLGGLAGGIVGAAAALLLAPKSGSELIKDITSFSFDGAHSHSTSHKKNTSRSSKRGGTAHKSSEKSPEKKARRSASSKKPSSSRRRTAAAASRASEEKATASASKEA